MPITGAINANEGDDAFGAYGESVLYAHITAQQPDNAIVLAGTVGIGVMLDSEQDSQGFEFDAWFHLNQHAGSAALAAHGATGSLARHAASAPIERH
jgi:hypothetical protein